MCFVKEFFNTFHQKTKELPGIKYPHLNSKMIISLLAWKIFTLFCRLQICSKFVFSKNSFRNTIRVSNSLHPDQALHFVGPDLGPN